MLARYPKDHEFGSALDPLEDVMVLTEYLTSEEYLCDLLVHKYQLGVKEARERGKAIKPHVKVALEYARQSISSSPYISFLPAYYAILNLLKVYILLGRYHADLPANRYHGAQYKPYVKDSHNLLTEKVTIHKHGAISLAYKSITGIAIADKVEIKLSDILSLQSHIGFEYTLATGRRAMLAHLQLEFEHLKGQTYIPVIHANPLDTGYTLSGHNLKVLEGFKKKGGVFHGRPVVSPSGDRDELYNLARKQLRTFLIYDDSYTPVSSKYTLFPEELPIALLFFHMSSVVRYKPEFLEKLSNSRYWPVLVAARRHCLLKIMYLFWSHVHKENLKRQIY